MAKKFKFFDTYSSSLVDFVPLKEGEVSIYYCGPTVYNYAHIGNLRPVITFDLLFRVLKEAGYKVRMISNYTDIDDKIIKEAIKENKTEKEISSFYIEQYEKNLKDLNILPLENHPRVSNYIDEIVDFIEKIIENGHAYKAHGDVYFRVSDFASTYGNLSKMKIDDLVSGARISKDDSKESPLDFALWKYTDDEGIKFDTKLGLGRPGWHTECVVMINSYFKTPLIDIHGGGFDLKFPHHENEMVQSMAYSGTRLANYWMHCGFILMNNEKMSKSLGNIVLAKDAIAKFGGNAIRHLFLSTYYRSPINFTEQAITTSVNEVKKYETIYRKLEAKKQLNSLSLSSNLDEGIYEAFMEHLLNDLNVSNAFTELEKTVKSANVLLRKNDIDLEEFSKVYNTFNKLISIIGFSFDELKITEEDKELYSKYMDARKNKDFETSDKYRPLLIEKGII